MNHRQFFGFAYSRMVKEAGSIRELEQFLEQFDENKKEITTTRRQQRAETQAARAATDPRWGESEEGRNEQLGLMSYAGTPAAARRRPKRPD